MNTNSLNLFIVDENQLLVSGLSDYLSKRFGQSINIITYFSAQTALSNVNELTDLVILDYYAEGEIGHEMMNAIKKLNPKTTFILLSNNEDIGVALDAFQNTNNAFVIKNENAKPKIISLIQNLFTYPIKFLVKEFGVSKYLAIFLLAFLSMLVVVFTALYFIRPEIFS